MGKNPPANAGDTGLIPGQGTKIPHAVAKKKKKKNWRSSMFFELKATGKASLRICC